MCCRRGRGFLRIWIQTSERIGLLGELTGKQGCTLARVSSLFIWATIFGARDPKRRRMKSKWVKAHELLAIFQPPLLVCFVVRPPRALVAYASYEHTRAPSDNSPTITPTRPARCTSAQNNMLRRPPDLPSRILTPYIIFLTPQQQPQPQQIL